MREWNWPRPHNGGCPDNRRAAKSYPHFPRAAFSTRGISRNFGPASLEYSSPATGPIVLDAATTGLPGLRRLGYQCLIRQLPSALDETTSECSYSPLVPGLTLVSIVSAGVGSYGSHCSSFSVCWPFRRSLLPSSPFCLSLIHISGMICVILVFRQRSRLLRRRNWVPRSQRRRLRLQLPEGILQGISKSHWASRCV